MGKLEWIQAMELYLDGYTMQEIADTVGCSTSNVNRFFNGKAPSPSRDLIKKGWCASKGISWQSIQERRKKNRTKHLSERNTDTVVESPDGKVVFTQDQNLECFKDMIYRAVGEHVPIAEREAFLKKFEAATRLMLE